VRIASVPIEVDSDQLLCVVGPTASGKTELAIRICEEVDGEIVSADSVQIYRGFDIGTGKPTAQERARARHHLVDVADARDPWDAARWAAEAERVIEDVRGRGKVPVICGGTYLWVRALVFGLAAAPAGSPELRRRLEAEAREHGRSALHARLAQVDPEAAARLSPNDFVRVQRALEVFELTGRRLSDLQREHRACPARHRARLVGVRRSGAVLDQRIAARAAQWIRGGWVEEVRGLVASGMRDTRPMSSVGYRQVLDFIEGRMAESELVGAITRATRVFARRQRTWLRDEPVVWVDPG